MTSILEEFAKDNLSTSNKYFEKNSDYGKIMNRLAKKEYELLGRLDEEGKGIYDEFTKAQTEISFLDSTGRFVTGYRLGVLMTIEVFFGRDELIV